MVGDFLSFLVGRDHKFDPVARRLYGRVLRWLRALYPFVMSLELMTTAGLLELQLRAGISAKSASDRRLSDDPIDNWSLDRIGRRREVRELETHVLDLNSPIVALTGSFGDGKTSVLRLLESEIEKREPASRAVVVRFSAWLPGSESTFALDLFREIAAECRKQFIVPQLKTRFLAFARTISGSVGLLPAGRSINFSSTLKDLFPAPSQKDEIEGLHKVFRSIPKRIVILLDEMDRMQPEELLVLLKILRGAATIPNASFICAFSRRDLERILNTGKSNNFSPDYLEKFFPISINLPTWKPELIEPLFLERTQEVLQELGWSNVERQPGKSTELLAEVWEQSIKLVCTNPRKLNLLLNDFKSAGGRVVNEVNPIDLLVITVLRRFAPSLYLTVRDLGEKLTCQDQRRGSLSPATSSADTPFQQLDSQTVGVQQPMAIRWLLGYIFPQYAASNCVTGMAQPAFRGTEPSAHFSISMLPTRI